MQRPIDVCLEQRKWWTENSSYEHFGRWRRWSRWLHVVQLYSFNKMPTENLTHHQKQTTLGLMRRRTSKAHRQASEIFLLRQHEKQQGRKERRKKQRRMTLMDVSHKRLIFTCRSMQQPCLCRATTVLGWLDFQMWVWHTALTYTLLSNRFDFDSDATNRTTVTA